jgi:hypothetical protein
MKVGREQPSLRLEVRSLWVHASMRTCFNELAGCLVPTRCHCLQPFHPFASLYSANFPPCILFPLSLCDSLTTCSWCLNLCTGFESFLVSNIDRCKDGAQAGIRGVTPSSRNAPMNPNSLGIAIESDEIGPQEVCSLSTGSQLLSRRQ